jgi:PKD repeat protein
VPVNVDNRPPAADFTALPLSGEDPLNVQFTDTSTYKPVSWVWDFGDGTTSTEQNPAHTYVNPGAYTVSLTAGNSSGTDIETKADYITISNAIPPTVLITFPGSKDKVSGAITVSASATDNAGVAGVRFKLDDSDIGAEDTIAPYSISWDTTAIGNGRHILSAVARDIFGNASTSPSVIVRVLNFPPTFIDASPNPCIFRENEIYCDTIVTWSSRFRRACIYAYYNNNSRGKLISCEGADVHDVPVGGISKEGTTFKLHKTKSKKSEVLSEVFVRGRARTPAEITFSNDCATFDFQIAGESGPRDDSLLINERNEGGRIIKTTGTVTYDNSGNSYDVNIDVTWKRVWLLYCIESVNGVAEGWQ